MPPTPTTAPALTLTLALALPLALSSCSPPPPAADLEAHRARVARLQEKLAERQQVAAATAADLEEKSAALEAYNATAEAAKNRVPELQQEVETLQAELRAAQEKFYGYRAAYGEWVREAAVGQTIPSITTPDGTTFKNAEISALDDVRLSVKHDTGIRSIPLATLPEDLQQKFGFGSENPLAATGPGGDPLERLREAREQYNAAAVALKKNRQRFAAARRAKDDLDDSIGGRQFRGEPVAEDELAQQRSLDAELDVLNAESARLTSAMNQAYLEYQKAKREAGIKF